MWNSGASVSYINSHVEPNSLGKCAAYVRRAVEAGGVTIRIPPPRIGNSASACDYGPSFELVGFKSIYAHTGTGPTDTAIIPGQQTGDVVVIQPIAGHPHGHIALFNGTHWVSDFVQLRGFYPGPQYRNVKPAYALYRYTDNADTNSKSTDKKKTIKIVWPIPSNKRGSEFGNQEEILSHLDGESTGLYMIGRNGMWHGGIHITNATTPWCALSGKAASEVIDFPVAFKGDQAVRCMVDGEVVAYRICKDYLTLGWETGPLNFSGSFVLVKHYIQPGEKEASGLHFYTLYMHLAPYSAYNTNSTEENWTVQDALSAYDPEWVMTASTNNKSISESYRKGTMPKGAIVEWDKTDSNLHTVAFNKREYGLVTFVGFTEEALKKGKKTSLKPGLQYWMLVDKNNIVPGTDGIAQPSWWRQLLPPAKDVMKFDQVICPTPYPISASDPVGHMGYYQVPKDGGYEARYQVHIECMSMDDNLERFLTNPEKVGEKSPLYLKYSPSLILFKKDVTTGTFSKDTKVTTRTGILPLSQVTTEADKSTKQEYWQLRPENSYVPKGQTEPQLLSQYDLAKLGFRTEIAEPLSFDYLDGKKQPTGLFRNIIESLHGAAKDDARTSHALVKHNYQRLLDKIDSGAADYSSMEYWRAIHNPDYRDVIQKTIVKHPSDWYFKKDDAIWQPFLNALKKEAPEWKKYSEEFLDKMAWMQDVTTEKLGPSLWHMHPIAFLNNFLLSSISTEEARVRAFMRMIRVCEGTTGEEGYERLFGGESFIRDYHKTFTTHPQIKITRKNKKTGKKYISSAAGAYQVMGYTWDDRSMVFWRKEYGITDFTPESQDLLCVIILKEKVRDNALDMIIQGKIKEAIENSCSYEWASLPPARHNQPIKSLSECLRVYSEFFKEEMEGKTDLHIKNGFLNGF
ncbi:lysozyme [Yersinia mollaretii]|uniref:glycoside hydrolase family 24 protein n=1 Tax=Yersinia mollaretii TaxID=33060 RepID=UPI0005DB115F|nr:glycoside hydrolase family 104 protein [Yersinia mollaretii]CNL04709.1 lysozyme [Yersinia mollaretii]